MRSSRRGGGGTTTGAGVVARGDVTVRQEGDEPVRIEDGAVLEDTEVRPAGQAQ